MLAGMEKTEGRSQQVSAPVPFRTIKVDAAKATRKKPADTEVESYTIITCEPNDLRRSIRNRMPVILERENYQK